MPSPQSSAHTGRRAAALATLALALCWGCSSDSNAPAAATNTGQACASVDACYPGVNAGDLVGAAVCLDKVTGGYCTHLCTQDTDCCAAAGECSAGESEVCGPFESTGDMYCFLSCEDAELNQANISDGDVYCQTFASAAFTCRSTGGGAKNRKVCAP